MTERQEPWPGSSSGYPPPYPSTHPPAAGPAPYPPSAGLGSYRPPSAAGDPAPYPPAAGPALYAPNSGVANPAAPDARQQLRPPSGLFPGGPPRPVYREPHPVRSGPLFAGMAATVVWFALFGGLAHDLAGYGWWTIVAALAAWLVAIVLAVLGDRGVAVGIAVASAFGLALAMAFVAGRWITTLDWPLW